MTSGAVSLSPSKSNRNSPQKRLTLPQLAWSPEEEDEEDAVARKKNLTFPQLSPSMILKETLHSLDSKVPLIPGLDQVMMLCTTKIGTKRFQTPDDAEFDLRIPHSPGLEYNNLHDPHLKKYFCKPHVRKSLTKQGLITESGLVKCSAREFNEYRRWIRRLKLNRLEAEAKEDQEARQNSSDAEDRRLTKHALEALEDGKRKQFQAKKNYEEKLRKKDDERRRLMRNLEHEFKAKEQSREDHQQTKRMKCKMKGKEEEIRRCEHKVKEENRKSARLQALSEKDEQYLRRKKELENFRKSARKEKEKMAIEKWRRRQHYYLKMMEEKKLQEDKEMSLRRENMLKRNEIFTRERQKREEELERSMALSRKLAIEKLKKANRFLKKTEKRREAEIGKWREKNSKFKPQKLRLDLPTKSKNRSPKSAKNGRIANSREGPAKKSIWTIDQCLTASNDDTLGSQAIMISDQCDDSFQDSLNEVETQCEQIVWQDVEQHEVPLQNHEIDLQPDISDACPLGQQITGYDLENHDNAEYDHSGYITFDALSRRLSNAIVLKAADQLGMDIEAVKEAIASHKIPETSDVYQHEIISNSFYTGLDQQTDENSVGSLRYGEHPNAPYQFDKTASGGFGIEANKGQAISFANPTGHDFVQELDCILSLEAKQLAEDALKYALKTLGDTDAFDVKSLSQSTNQSIGDIQARSSFSMISRESGQALNSMPVNGMIDECKKLSKSTLTESCSSESIVCMEAKRIALEAIVTALNTLDPVTKSCDINRNMISEDSSHMLRGNGMRGTDVVGNSLGSFAKVENHLRDGSCASSTLRNSYSYDRIEAFDIVTESVLGAARKLGYADDDLDRMREIVQATQNYVERSTDRYKEAKVHFHDESIIERTPSKRSYALATRLPTPHSSMMNINNKGDDKNDAVAMGNGLDGVSFIESQEFANNIHRAGVNMAIDGAEPSMSSREELLIKANSSKSVTRMELGLKGSIEKERKDFGKEHVTKKSSTESAESEHSQAQVIKLSNQGRRPTPYFSKTEKKRLFEGLSGNRHGMMVFGEEDEEEDEEDAEEVVTKEEDKEIAGKGTEGGELLEVDEENSSVGTSYHLPNADLHQFDSRLTGSLPELERGRKSQYNIPLQRTFSSCVTSPNATCFGRGKITDEGLRKVSLAGAISQRKDSFSDLNHITSKTSEEKTNSLKNGLARRSSSLWTGSKGSMLGEKGGEASRISSEIAREKLSLKIDLAENDRLLSDSSTTSRSKKSIRSNQNLKPAGEVDIVLVKSTDSVGSGSSHILPHVRPSKSRLTCKIDMSVYSCANNDVQSATSLSSEELNGAIDEQEIEEVVRIELPENDGMQIATSEGKVESLPEDFEEKLCKSLMALEKSRSEVSDSLQDGTDDTVNAEKEKSKDGFVAGFRYSDYMQKTIPHKEDEDLNCFAVINETELKNINHLKEGVLSNTAEESEQMKEDSESPIWCEKDNAISKDDKSAKNDGGVCGDRKKGGERNEYGGDGEKSGDLANIASRRGSKEIRDIKENPARRESSLRKAVLQQNSEPIFRRGSNIVGSNGLASRLSAVSLPGQERLTQEESEDRIFNVPRRLSTRSRSSLILPRNSQMQPVPEIEDNL